MHVALVGVKNGFVASMHFMSSYKIDIGSTTSDVGERYSIADLTVMTLYRTTMHELIRFLMAWLSENRQSGAK